MKEYKACTLHRVIPNLLCETRPGDPVPSSKKRSTNASPVGEGPYKLKETGHCVI